MTQAKSAERQELEERTFRRTIKLLQERESREGAWSLDWRSRGKLYLQHLSDGRPINNVRIPEEVKVIVSATYKQACEETGFVPPPRQPKPKRKKKRR
jgi:hypothetical protein